MSDRNQGAPAGRPGSASDRPGSTEGVEERPSGGALQASMTAVIIDDVLPNALILESYISAMRDVDTETFTDPVQALDWCKANQPDLILVDYRMPKLDGIEFIRRIRADAHLVDVPALVVTGDDERDALYRALEAGANDFLKKPVDPIELKVRVRNMLRLRSRQVELAEANRRLTHLATTDALTGLVNRRRFFERLEQEVSRARDFGQALSVLLLDVDHFKQVNDSYGHAIGDQVLAAVGQICQRAVRSNDCPARVGGEEFVLLLPNTSIDAARSTAERIRMAVSELQVWDGEERIAVTASIGIAQLNPETDDAPELLQRADRALYRAKAEGRNRTVAELDLISSKVG